MDTTTREEWLASLKPGDQVAIQRGVSGRGKYILATLVKVPTSPRGRFITDNGTQFGPDGREWASTSQEWTKDRLVEVTPELVEGIKKSDLVSSTLGIMRGTGHAQLDALSIEALEEISAVLKKHMQKS